MDVIRLLDELTDWALGIHPVFYANKFQKFVLEFIEKAKREDSEEYFCMSKKNSFMHAIYFLRRRYSSFLRDERE